MRRDGGACDLCNPCASRTNREGPATMTETKTAEREAVTLDLEPQPIHAPATVDRSATPATTAAPGAAGHPALTDDSPLARILELKRLGITKEDLNDYLEMQRTHEAREAKKAYDRAMTAWKAEGIPTIPKNVHVFFKNRDGKITDYWHEDLADVVNTVLPLMAAVGLSHSWDPIQEGRGENMLITVRTIVTHTQGHSETRTLYAAPDPSGGKNAIQAVKSSISYLERIGLLAILGLAAKGHDDDGRGGAPRYVEADPREPGADDDRGDWPDDQGGEPPSSARTRGKPETSPPQATSGTRSTALATEKQIGLIVARLREKGIDRSAVCELYGVPSLEDLQKNRVDEVLKWIGQQR